MRWLVEDPDKNLHVVEETDDGVWFGCENLAMHYNKEERFVILRLLQREFKQWPNGGVWESYSWIPKFS